MRWFEHNSFALRGYISYYLFPTTKNGKRENIPLYGAAFVHPVPLWFPKINPPLKTKKQQCNMSRRDGLFQLSSEMIVHFSHMLCGENVTVKPFSKLLSIQHRVVQDCLNI